LLKYLATLACCALLLSVSSISYAKPKTTIEYGYTLDKYPKVRITNDTSVNLLCYVAIDGYKQKFKLTPQAKSKWYKATDKRFTFDNFSIWCDFANNQPMPDHS
jgi:hypothetical protein